MYLTFFIQFIWRRKWQPTAGFPPGKSMGRGAWWAAAHGVAEELDTTAAKQQPNLTH